MTWKKILKNDAWEMEERYGKRSDQIVEDFASADYITVRDPKTGEYAEFDFDDGSEGYELNSMESSLKEGSKLDRFIKETNKPDGKPKMAIHPSNQKEIEEMGFEMEV